MAEREDGADALAAAERRAIQLEEEGRLEEALALCEAILDGHTSRPHHLEASRAEAQFAQRRLRLLRKLGRPVWSSQGTPF
jgi:hypothetical protein